MTFKFQDFPRSVRTLYKVIGELEPADQIGSTDSRHDLNESLVALERASCQHCSSAAEEIPHCIYIYTSDPKRGQCRR